MHLPSVVPDRHQRLRPEPRQQGHLLLAPRQRRCKDPRSAMSPLGRSGEDLWRLMHGRVFCLFAVCRCRAVRSPLVPAAVTIGRLVRQGMRLGPQ